MGIVLFLQDEATLPCFTLNQEGSLYSIWTCLTRATIGVLDLLHHSQWWENRPAFHCFNALTSKNESPRLTLPDANHGFRSGWATADPNSSSTLRRLDCQVPPSPANVMTTWELNEKDGKAQHHPCFLNQAVERTYLWAEVTHSILSVVLDHAKPQVDSGY